MRFLGPAGPPKSTWQINRMKAHTGVTRRGLEPTVRNDATAWNAAVTGARRGRGVSRRDPAREKITSTIMGEVGGGQPAPQRRAPLCRQAGGQQKTRRSSSPAGAGGRPKSRPQMLRMHSSHICYMPSHGSGTNRGARLRGKVLDLWGLGGPGRPNQNTRC